MARYEVNLTDSFVVHDDMLEPIIEALLEESDYGEGPELNKDDAWFDAFADLIKEELEHRFRDGYPLTFKARKLDSEKFEPYLHVTTGE